MLSILPLTFPYAACYLFHHLCSRAIARGRKHLAVHHLPCPHLLDLLHLDT